MDRRIPPELPLAKPLVPHDANELKIKQGMHREAFDSALRTADQRRSMSQSDRVVSSDLKQLQALNERLANEKTPANQYSEWSGIISDNLLNRRADEFEQFESTHKEPDAEASIFELLIPDHHASSSSIQATTGSTRQLKDESLSFIIKRITESLVALDDSIELEVINDPSGIVSIKATKDQNNGWTLDLNFGSERSHSDANERDLSEQLTQKLQQAGIQINNVVVGVEQSTALLEER